MPATWCTSDINEQMMEFHDSVTQTAKTLQRKIELKERLHKIILDCFPRCGLYIVGSSLNGFGNNSSDMDLCLMITNKDLDQRTDAVVVLNHVMNCLINSELIRENGLKLIIAKVPILRIMFNAPYDDIIVDLNANNAVAIKNTHLLCHYAAFDWRVRPLVSVIKEWAKHRGMNDANKSSFTSYSLVLMVVHFLQCGLSKPLLPSLQKMYSKRFSEKNDVRNLQKDKPLDPPAVGEWEYDNSASLCDLLLGFLKYYAFEFDYNQHAISVRLGKRTDRAYVAGNCSTSVARSQWGCICIEEPFNLSNTAHSIHNQMIFDAIVDALKFGFAELMTNRDLHAFLSQPPIKTVASDTCL
ncbi:hypothetical protein L596_008559 [Steinernema carpocapsae]|uniref:Uncharacterized protein n=1 Tax=Steinernema carpocapsae TaxID=34508 RepID=A0A4U5PD03_STECR|nr:hypothetical protein L596_008559 [Steinernema carpocapsae]